MLWYTLVLSTLTIKALAFDAGYPIWCNETQDGPCLQRLSDACYACIHPIEAACPGTDKPFYDCLCPIPSNSWTAIEKCFNDPSTGCNDGATGSTSEVFALLNPFAVECGGYNQFICEIGAKLDNVEQTLSIIEGCTPTSGSATSVPSTSAAVTSTSSAAATTSAASSAATTTATTSQATSGSGSATRAPTTTTSSGAVPTSNAAANNMVLNSCYALALALGGAAINVL